MNSAYLHAIAPVLNAQISKQISNFAEKASVAAVQADIIAHSLGGLAIRTLPQCGGTFQDCNIPFRTASNYSQGSIHRLITVSSPNLGTPIADIMVNNRDNTCLDGLAPGSTTLSIRVFGVPVFSESLNIVAAAPGLFSAEGRTLLQNSDYTLNTSVNGASPGTYVVLYFTGQGALDNPVDAGVAAPAAPLARTQAKTEVSIGGVQCDVVYSGLTPGLAGLAQANIRIPDLPSGDYALTLAVGGLQSNSGTCRIPEP